MENIFSPNIVGIVGNPSLGGKELPLSVNLAGANWGQYYLKKLVRFKEGRRGEGPSWEGRGEDMTTHEAGVPITDREWWAGRWALCEVTLEREDGNRLVLADAVAAVSREKRIVSTALTGRDGTVKEYINDGDWTVSIVAGVQAVRDGAIADEWPGEELRELCKYLDEPGALRVHSAFLDIFGITHIVVKGRSVTQMTEQNYQAVSISAVSDEEYEIYSNEYSTGE